MKSLTLTLIASLLFAFSGSALAADPRSPAQRQGDAWWTAQLNAQQVAARGTKVSSESRVIVIPGVDRVAPTPAPAKPAPNVSRHPGVRVTPIEVRIIAPGEVAPHATVDQAPACPKRVRS